MFRGGGGGGGGGVYVYVLSYNRLLLWSPGVNVAVGSILFAK